MEATEAEDGEVDSYDKLAAELATATNWGKVYLVTNRSIYIV
jgi:hypothetical protein